MPTRLQKRPAATLRNRLRRQLHQAVIAGVAIGATTAIPGVSFADGDVELSAPLNAPTSTPAVDRGWARRAATVATEEAVATEKAVATDDAAETPETLPAPTLEPATEAIVGEESDAKTEKQQVGGTPAQTVAGPLDRFRGPLAKLPVIKRKRNDRAKVEGGLGTPVVQTPGDKVLDSQAAAPSPASPRPGDAWQTHASADPNARLTGTGKTQRADSDDFRPSAVEGNWVAREAINRVEPLRDPVKQTQPDAKVNQFEAVRAQAKAAQDALAKAAADKVAQEKAAKEKAAKEQAAAKAALEEAAKEAAEAKAARDRIALAKVAREKAAQERAARDQAALEQIAREKADLEQALRKKEEQERALLAAQKKAAEISAANREIAGSEISGSETAGSETAKTLPMKGSAGSRSLQSETKIIEMVSPKVNASASKAPSSEAKPPTQAVASPQKSVKPLPKRVASTESAAQKILSNASPKPATRQSVRSADIAPRRETSSKATASKGVAASGVSSKQNQASASVGDLKPNASKAVAAEPAESSVSDTILDYTGQPSSEMRVTQKVASYRRSIERSLKYFYDRPEIATGRSNWGMMHSLMVYGADTKLIVGRKKYSAIAWIAGNNNCRGQRLLTQGAKGLQAKSGVGLQGHQGQFLAVLGMCDVPTNYPLHAGKQKYDVASLIEAEKLACKAGEELTFTLIGLSHYIDTDSTWMASDGTKWDFERLIAEELKQPIVGAACGGTHRLMGYAHALRKRRAEGKPITGHWKRAEIFTEDFIRYAYSLQNRDGSMSTKWFEGRADNGDVDRKLQTTGHMVEWLLTVTPDDQLQDRRLVAAVSFLVRAVGSDLDHDWSIGPKGHALRSLAMYHQRVFKAGTPWIPSSVARRTNTANRSSR